MAYQCRYYPFRHGSADRCRVGFTDEVRPRREQVAARLFLRALAAADAKCFSARYSQDLGVRLAITAFSMASTGDRGPRAPAAKAQEQSLAAGSPGRVDRAAHHRSAAPSDTGDRGSCLQFPGADALKYLVGDILLI